MVDRYTFIYTWYMHELLNRWQLMQKTPAGSLHDWGQKHHGRVVDKDTHDGSDA